MVAFCTWSLIPVLALLISACSGSPSGGENTGGGGGNGGGNGGGGYVAPASGDYLLEVGPDYSLSYATIDSTTGVLSTPKIAVSEGSSGFSPDIAVAPSGKFLYSYLVNTGELVAYQMGGPGLQLKRLLGYTQSLPYEWSFTPHPSGKFMYAMGSEPMSTIQEFAVDPSNGSLTPGPQLTEDADLRSGIFDSTGKLLFVNDLSRGRIFVYQVDQTTGHLSPAANSPFTLPANERPAQLAIGGAGTNQFLYAEIYSSGAVAAFSIDSSTAALTTVPGSPFESAGNPSINFCVDRSAKFLYSSNSTTGLISGFVIDPATGVLSPVPGSPFSTSMASGPIVSDPSGKFLYVPNQNNIIYGFSLDSATGSLAPLAGSPYQSVKQLGGITTMRIP